MAKVLVWVSAVVLACAGGASAANCACQCIEGVARTLCTTVAEAQANPNACGVGEQRVACEIAPPSSVPVQRYEPPEGAVDCRGARLWDPRSNSYAVVAKVCNLDRDAAGGG
ncbi:MAG TPA: hypothetical protein VL379_12180 [Pseudomonadales bacterium]|jgi:hypothetical protein|nr:hypothetical protein [Pseudomonadales bacterium]